MAVTILFRRPAFAVAVIVGFAATSAAEDESAGARIPVILDTDIGSAIDDAFALGYLVALDRFEILGVTTCCSAAADRARLVSRFLDAVGRPDVPVIAGADPQPGSSFDDQSQYVRRPRRIGNSSTERAVEFLYRTLRARPGKVTIIAIGPLTNIARLIEQHPEVTAWIRRLVVMGGALDVGYSGSPPVEPEWNFKTDVAAAQRVLSAEVPLWVVPLDATVGLKLSAADARAIFRRRTPLAYELWSLWQLAGGGEATLFDALAVRMAFDPAYGKVESLPLEVEADGMLKRRDGAATARVCVSVDSREFLKEMATTLRAFGDPSPVPTFDHDVSLREHSRGLSEGRSTWPRRVHVVEDYETTIESRWWLAGVRRRDDDGRHYAEGVLSWDFDGAMGERRARYTAVVFNPVPGPPMGESTRLRFRYRLDGSRRLRVQIYSLSRGFHRALTLTELEEGRWQEITVDLTQARRPDGTGGALSSGERIDDLQFYTDPGAGLEIDGMVLYDAPPLRASEEPADSATPFPARVLFTAWFDTGRQGTEWPGDFEIVRYEEAASGKAARSVPRPESTAEWVRLSLRGKRRLREWTHARFRYRLVGADHFGLELLDSATGVILPRELSRATQDAWVEADVPFQLEEGEADRFVDELRFVLPPGAQLWLDDVLLFEPASPKTLPHSAHATK